MKKNILITGASGFIGSFLVEEALNRNYQTFAGIRSASNKQYLRDQAIRFLELDFSNSHLLDIALAGYAKQYGRFDYIIHTAGLTKTINKAEFDFVNFEHTKSLVQALQRNNLVPDKFVYISSLASFGPGMGSEPITSTMVRQPLTEYGKSKLKAEQFLYANPAFPFLIINPAAVYGPRDKDFFFLLKSIENHLELYIGSSEQLLSFVHVHDLVSAIFLSMESAAFNQSLLVSDLQTYTSKKVNQLIKERLNKKTISLIIPPNVAGAFAVFSELIGNIRGKVPIVNRERLKEFKAKNWSVDCSEMVELGYEPKFNLEEGLSHSINWYKEQGWMKR